MKNSNTQQIMIAQREGRRRKITILSNGFVRVGFQVGKPITLPDIIGFVLERSVVDQNCEGESV